MGGGKARGSRQLFGALVEEACEEAWNWVAAMRKSTEMAPRRVIPRGSPLEPTTSAASPVAVETA
tara:strand:+ start:1890 stop:2084 length:195 start_codon:yes stop_codon:yes gene_type:complete